jgi:hypothetical protein
LADRASMQIVPAEVSVRRAVLIVLLALPALAEEKPGVKVVQEADRIVVRKRTVIDFNDVTVEGELTKPEGSYVLNRNRTRFRSLVRLRDNFNPELQKSADNL